MKHQIKNKSKFIRSITIIFSLLFLLLVCFANTYSTEETRYKTIMITTGDTLWSIAEKEEENNSYYQHKDIRQIVYDIKQKNQLNNSSLTEGTVLQIPSY
jgi:LysM repeat protein